MGSAHVWAQFKDATGNPSPITGAAITLDTTPPVGSITINAGAQYTNTTAVTLNLWARRRHRQRRESMWLCNMVKNAEGNWILPADFLFTAGALCG